MNKIKIIGILVLVVFLAGFWIMGCTGEGVYDSEPQPTGTYSPPPVSPTSTITTSPTGTVTPGETLDTIATGRANSFDLRVYTNVVAPKTKYVYWVEKSSTPSGGVFRAPADGSGKVETIVTGLERPSAFTVLSADDKSRDKNGKVIKATKDYVLVAESGNPSNAVIYRVDLTSTNFDKTQITSGMQGDLVYMSISSGYIYFTRDAGGVNSGLMRVDVFPDNTPAIPEAVDSNLTNAYDVKAFYIQGKNKADNQSFALVTERLGSDGRVLLYNLTGDPILPLVPFEVSTNESYASRVTFQPIYESDNSTPKYPLEGYVYWTCYQASSGLVVRQKVKYNSNTSALELDGVREIVAQSLKYPYMVKVPNDFASGSLKGTLNKIIVSSNRSKAEGGNFYVIDVSNSNSFPLTPADTEVQDLISEPVAFPLNAIIEYTSSTITMFFTTYNDTTGGNNDGMINYFRLTE